MSYQVLNFIDSPDITKPMFWHFLLLIACTIDQNNYDDYCYDNIIADMTLNSGNKPKGIYGYFDVYTWEGFFKLMVISAFYQVIKQFVAGTIVALMFVLTFAVRSDLKFCTKGELGNFPLTNTDICEAYYWNVL